MQARRKLYLLALILYASAMLVAANHAARGVKVRMLALFCSLYGPLGSFAPRLMGFLEQEQIPA